MSKGYEQKRRPVFKICKKILISVVIKEMHKIIMRQHFHCIQLGNI